MRFTVSLTEWKRLLNFYRINYEKRIFPVRKAQLLLEEKGN